MPENDNAPLLTSNLYRAKKHLKRYAYIATAFVAFFALLLYLRGPIVGAVVSNVKGCAHVGGRMLISGGSAVDAAIATLICEGVLMAHCTGLGGGFVGLIYTKSDGRVESITAREVAPALASENLLEGQRQNDGALATGVPGQILGYWEMHQRYGRLAWSVLFQPSIRLCRQGHWISKHYAMAIRKSQDQLLLEPTMRDVFFDEDMEPYKAGHFIKRSTLADTLERIAKYGPADFYNGGVTGEMFVKDVQEMGGILTLTDLENYRVMWHRNETVRTNISGGYTLYTTPLPSNGVLLTFILNVMDKFYTNYTPIPIYYHRLVETFKYAFGQRAYLGDMYHDPEMRPTIEKTYENLQSPQFAKQIRNLISDYETSKNMSYYSAEYSNVEDHGTSNIAVLAANGDAVILTSSLNNYFGAKKRSLRTGIILNDQLNDFSIPNSEILGQLPPSPSNLMKPNKWPLSSMCPSIVLDENGNVILLIGAAGGHRIVTAVSTTILRYLILNQTLNAAIRHDRLHHQLTPMVVEAESRFPIWILDYLASVGHNISKSDVGKNYAAVTAIGVRMGEPEPVCDRRRGGSASLRGIEALKEELRNNDYNVFKKKIKKH